ncbi:MAG: M23 family metallopeptidase [bacterium]|nr:M23 family metallopeptidase [bacterium]
MPWKDLLNIKLVKKRPMQAQHKRLLVVVATAVGFVFSTYQAVAWEVAVDGTVLGVIRQTSPVKMVIASKIKEVEEERGAEAGLTSEISFRPVLKLKTEIEEVLAASVSAALVFGQKAAVISVNGLEVVALANKAVAEGLLAEIKSRYLPKGKTGELESLGYKESIEIIEKYRTLDAISDQKEAANVLLFGSEKLLQHTVGRGESFWSIATKYDIRVSTLQLANPHIKPEKLQIGQKVSLKMDEPFVHVETVEKRVYSTSVAYSTIYELDNSSYTWESRVKSAGKAGANQITARVTSINGKEEKRDLLSTIVLSNPVSQVVVKGSKTAPSFSTGSFLWPTTGIITSPFGPRWGGYHYGVDIGAAKGTTIYAADSGIVSFAGNNSGYGLMVRIEHSGDSATLYAHSSKLLVTQNQEVVKGQAIALVGNTGNSYGAHLHFEIHKNGKPLNPLNYFR